MIPVALALGSGSRMFEPSSIAVVCGIVASMALTLMVAPAAHYDIARRRRMTNGDWQVRHSSFVIRNFIQGGPKVFETGREQVGLAADADAEVVGHLEKSPGHDRGFISVPQQRAEPIHIPAFQAREDYGAEGRPNAVQIGPRIEEPFEKGAIRF